MVQRSLKVPISPFPMATHCSKIMEFMMLVGKLKVCYAMIMYSKGDIKWISDTLSLSLTLRYVAALLRLSLTQSRRYARVPYTDTEPSVNYCVFVYRNKMLHECLTSF